MRNSTHSFIASKISQSKKGTLIFPSDFRSLGTEPGIKTALARLEKEGMLKRLARGIYLVPDHDPLLGIKYPSLEEIAEAIAKRDHARIRPAGTYALHKLGLSTQVPMNLVYLTDGAPRKVKIGKGSIKFKATTAKKLSLKGKISSLVIQALEELGQKNVTSNIWEQIRPILKREDPVILAKDMKLAPAWINTQLMATNEKNEEK
ncbi:MAG: DUF6088 family protein [Chitinophagaceae bacterium]